MTSDHKVISSSEHIFTHYLSAWNYVQKHLIAHYAIEKLSLKEWKLTIISLNTSSPAR
jgi:hypothetical protein